VRHSDNMIMLIDIKDGKLVNSYDFRDDLYLFEPDGYPTLIENYMLYTANNRDFRVHRIK
jgi:hypothetical protein